MFKRLRHEAELAESEGMPETAEFFRKAADEIERIFKLPTLEWMKAQTPAMQKLARLAKEDQTLAAEILGDLDAFERFAKRREDGLKAIVDKLPKCWRLNDEGEWVRDVPVVPGMIVRGLGADDEEDPVVVRFVGCACLLVDAVYSDDGYDSLKASEAAEAAKGD